MNDPFARGFASDNASGVHPAVMDAMKQVNVGHAIAYGWDPHTVSAIEAFRNILGETIEVFFVYNGTGANVLALDAVTRYRRLATVELPFAVDRYPQSRYSLVALAPRQGRKHQLRRHMKHLGYPIIGDAKYGKGVHNRFFQAQYQCDRLLLACTAMELVHPVGQNRLHLKAALDETFSNLVKTFGWEGVLQPEGVALYEPAPELENSE